MNDTVMYLVKVSVAISLVSIPYYLWLRQDAALNIKRIYLAGGILLSWLFPLLSVRKPEALSMLTNTIFIDPYAAETPSIAVPATVETGDSFSLTSILIGIYLVGFIILVLRHLIMFYKVKGIDRLTDAHDKSVVYTNSNQVFTLFSKIFIPSGLRSERDYDSILIHEKAHLHQLHMVDLLIAESSLLLTWFNPFSWLISRMIKENHEHLADRSVLLKGVNPAHYKAQLLNHTMGVELFSLGSQFNHSLTKKRFKMMKKIKSPKRGFIKYLGLVPAMIIALGLFTAATAQQKPFHGKVVFEDGEPAAGASIVVAGGIAGTVSDLDGTFSIEVEGNSELIVSFVGFKSVRLEAGKLSKQDIVLLPKAFVIDFEDVGEKGDREEQTNIKKDNSFISVNSDKVTAPKYFVNGKEVDDIKDIDPEDIERVEVIKEGQSKDGSNGEVHITLKKKGSSAKEAAKAKSADGQDEVFYIVEEMPSFTGGNAKLKAYIEENLAYPEKAEKKGLKGEVHVQFTVTQKGEVINTEVNRSTDEIFDEAALKVISDMPVWNPGRQRGKPVKVNIIVPVRFNPEQD